MAKTEEAPTYTLVTMPSSFTIDEVIVTFARVVYDEVGRNYTATAKRLGVSRATVVRWIRR